MMIHFGIVPYIVFDGDYLPSKSSTEIERASKREESKRLGLELHRLGKISQANLELQKAVDVTPEMAGRFIEELKNLGVQYLVAPYEADAQLAYLERKGVIDGILSEDSDLLVFGAKRLLTKLDQYGDCIEINRKDFTACREVSLVGWSDVEFRCMAILSGCDYLPNIGGMGLKTAYRLVRKYKTIDRILRILAFNNRHQIPAGYLESFQKADLTFLHQRVFCPVRNNILMMTSFGPGLEPADFTFIGSNMDQDVAIGVARGELHPMTKKPMVLESSTAENNPKPTSGRLRKLSGTTFSEMKGNKSIQAFFKSKRTPLAELDPNTFTPSPSQQRLLQHSSRAWISSPATSRSTLPRPNESMATSAPRVISKNLAGTLSGNFESQSLSRSPKRRRLCDEIEPEKDIEKQPANLGSSRSRFFNGPQPTANPSTENQKSNKPGKSTDINLWSDDSIEDVMAGLPDFPDCAKKRTMKVYRDKDQVNPVSTAVTSVRSSSQPVARISSENVSATMVSLSSEFSYQPAILGSKSITSTNMGIKPSHSNDMAAKPALAGRSRTTPLQRLAAGALRRPKSCPGSMSFASRSPLTVQPSSLCLETREGPKSMAGSIDKEPEARGSEDLIIPNSEDDSDYGFRSEADVTQKGPKLSLGRFAFIG